MSLSLPSRICVVWLICVVGADSAPVRVNLAAQAGKTDQNAPVQPVVQASALTVTGFVLKSDRKTSVPDVKARMRNITTGAVVGTTVSDRDGAFSFQAPGPGLYVIEAVKDDGRVRAITDQFTLADTVVKMDVILPGAILGLVVFSSVFAVLAAGTAAGVIPVIPPGQGLRPGPVVTSPER